MLIAMLEEKYPDFLDNPPNIQNLEQFYKEAKAKFEEDEEFKTKS